MLFKSNGKFIDNITDSFNRFGIQTKLSEKGTSKNIQKFEMYDSIHDSGYIAVAVEKPVGKDSAKEWENIINNDLMPSLLKDNSSNSSPASALIVPSKDIDNVEKLLQKKGLEPAIYQLFPGYVVAGINKKDTAKIIKDYKKKQNDDLAKKAEEIKNQPDEKTEKTDNKKQDIENKKTINNKEELLKELNTNKVDKPIQKEKEITKEEKPLKKEKPLDKKAKSNIAKKLAAAALLGTAIGIGAAALPDIQDKVENYIAPNDIENENKIMEDAAKKYFDGLKNGFEENDEILKVLARNPKLAEKYINELADTPVQTEALKNPAQPVDKLREKSKSNNEKTREAVAENPSTPQDVLNKLSKDKSVNVLKALSKNPSLPKNLMDNLSNYSGLHKSLLENPSLTPDILTKIVAGKQRDCEFNRLYMSNPCVSIKELIYNKNNPDECIREGIAKNPNTPVEVISQLVNDKNPAVRQSALKNKNLPKEEIDKLFPPNWLPDKNNSKLESDRMAVLENPNIDNKIIEKATFIDPVNYGLAAAKNRNLPASTVNKFANKARGKSGLKNFINYADNIKNNPEQINELKNEMKKNNESLNKPLRRMINKDFTEQVYDPYYLIDSMRKVPSKKRKYDISKNKDNKNNQNRQILDNLQSAPASVIDSSGNVPELFSKMPLPPISSNHVSYNPDAEMKILKTADDIIDEVVKKVTPDIEKAVAKNNNFSTNNSKNNNGNFSGSNSNPPVKTSSAGNGGNGYNNINNMPNKSNNIIDLSPDNMIMFKNACSRIDSLYSMF